MNNQEQIYTYGKRKNIEHSVYHKKLDGSHFNFITVYTKKNSKKIITLVVLLLIQTMIEICIIVFAGNTLHNTTFLAFHSNNLLLLISGVSLITIFYLFISFYALKIERTTVINFINEIRRIWFTTILNQRERSLTNEKGADFIAKNTYHFPLLSLGIDQSFMGIIRLLISLFVVITIGFIGNRYVLYASVAIILAGLITLLTSYIIAKYYVTKEVSSYSQVIRHIDNSLSEFSAIKKNFMEHETISELDNRVSIDTYYRIRRDLWLRYFNKVVYSTVFIFTFLLLIIGLYYPKEILNFYTADNAIMLGILSIYSVKLLHEAGKAGLYLPPLFLGLILSIPDRKNSEIKIKINKPWSKIEFRSNKTKLYPEGQYFKKINIEIKKGESYLFIGKHRYGKTSLAELITGNIRFNRNGWLIKVDNYRYDYVQWVKTFFDYYFISPYFKTEKTIGEIIFAKNKELINSDDILSLYDIANKNPLLLIPVSKRRFVGETMKVFEMNSTILFAIYTLHCLVMKPGLIVIDNQWLDMGSAEINELTKIIRSELSESAIIVFGSTNNEIIAYNNRYEIENQKIKAI